MEQIHLPLGAPGRWAYILFDKGNEGPNQYLWRRWGKLPWAVLGDAFLVTVGDYRLPKSSAVTDEECLLELLNAANETHRALQAGAKGKCMLCGGGGEGTCNSCGGLFCGDCGDVHMCFQFRDLWLGHYAGVLTQASLQTTLPHTVPTDLLRRRLFEARCMKKLLFATMDTLLPGEEEFSPAVLE